MRIIPTRRADARRPGAIMTVELIFVAPMVLIVVLGVTEFYMLISTSISLRTAARAGARVGASGTYADKARVNDEVQRTAKEVLGNGRLSRFASVGVTWSQDVPADQTAGQSDWVDVRVEVPARNVIPDVLGWVGFSISRDTLVADTKMKQE